MRIFATLDLHANFAANDEWLAKLLRADLVENALMVAINIAHRLHTGEITLSGLVERFAAVFFVAGNYELWVPLGVGRLVREIRASPVAVSCARRPHRDARLL